MLIAEADAQHDSGRHEITRVQGSDTTM
jgi:hypothetical protein